MIPEALASIWHYCLYLKDMAWKHTAYHIDNSDPGHIHLQKNLKITFANTSKNAVGKNEEKKIIAIVKAFCVTHKRKKWCQFSKTKIL